MTNWQIVSFGCMLAGGVLIVGSLIALCRQKMVVDGNGNFFANEIEIPLLGKIRTNAPGLAGIFIGAFLVALPLHKTNVTKDQLTFIGEFGVDEDEINLPIIVGAVPGRYLRNGNSIEGGIEMKVDEEPYYQVIALKLTGMKDARPTYDVRHAPAIIDLAGRTVKFRGSFAE